MKVPVRDGLELRIEERGRGPAVLLVHGFTGSVEAWGEDVLSGLARTGRRVVAVDLPGHGSSDVPADPHRISMERVVRDLADVLDALKLERPDWVGYSMGGRVALAAAVLRPERVRRLVLEGASPGLADADDRRKRRKHDEELALRIEEEGIEPFVDFWMDLPLFRTQRRLPAGRLERARRRRLRCRPGGLSAALRGLGTGRQPSFWDDLGEVTVPCLLLAGEDDAKYARIAGRMEERLPRAERILVADAGHTVHFEAPGAWLREVSAFLDRPAPRSPSRGGARHAGDGPGSETTERDD